jgi:hypothetical protein
MMIVMMTLGRMMKATEEKEYEKGGEELLLIYSSGEGNSRLDGWHC